MIVCAFCGGPMTPMQQRRGWRCCHECWQRRILADQSSCATCTVADCSMPAEMVEEAIPDSEYEDQLGW